MNEILSLAVVLYKEIFHAGATTRTIIFSIFLSLIQMVCVCLCVCMCVFLFIHLNSMNTNVTTLIYVYVLRKLFNII